MLILILQINHILRAN